MIGGDYRRVMDNVDGKHWQRIYKVMSWHMVAALGPLHILNRRGFSGFRGATRMKIKE